MERSPVLLVKGRDDPVVIELAARLKSATRLALHSGRPWLDRELESHLARRARLDCAVVVLMCPAARNEVLWRALLAHDPELIVVRIDLDNERANTPPRPLRVDLAFYFPRPRSHYRTGKHANELREAAPDWHISKPDRDNADKAILDQLTVLRFWRDDAQACDGRISKFYEDSRGPGCQVTISAT